MRRALLGYAAVVALPLLTACDASVFLAEPAPASADLAIRLVAGASGPDGASDGPAASIESARRAFDSVEEIEVVLSTETDVLVEEVFAVDPSGGDIRLGVRVEIDEPEVRARLRLDLRGGSGDIFRAESDVTLQQGRSSSAEVPLEAVAGSIAAFAEPAVLTALGDSPELSVVALFTTGDTIPDPPVTWTSLDPGVVEFPAGDEAVAVGEGTARLRASMQGLADTITVQVEQTVESLELSPAQADLAPGEVLQLEADARDRRGNPVEGRAGAWSSSDPDVAAVDEEGVVEALSPGSAEIRVELEGLEATADVTVESQRPDVETRTPDRLEPNQARLRARVNPRGVPVDVVFRWGTDPTLQDAFQTAPITLEAGASTVTVRQFVTDLQPEATYYVQARASGSAGARTGDIVAFETPRVIPAPDDLFASWDSEAGAVDVQWYWYGTLDFDDIVFEVERAYVEEVPGPFQRIATTTATQHFDPNPGTAGNTYAYRVRACRPTYCSGYSNMSQATVPSGTFAFTSSTGSSSIGSPPIRLRPLPGAVPKSSRVRATPGSRLVPVAAAHAATAPTPAPRFD